VGARAWHNWCESPGRQAYGIQSTFDEVSPGSPGIRLGDQPAPSAQAWRHVFVAHALPHGRNRRACTAKTCHQCASRGRFQHAESGQDFADQRPLSAKTTQSCVAERTLPTQRAVELFLPDSWAVSYGFLAPVASQGLRPGPMISICPKPGRRETRFSCRRARSSWRSLARWPSVQSQNQQTANAPGASSPSGQTQQRPHLVVDRAGAHQAFTHQNGAGAGTPEPLHFGPSVNAAFGDQKWRVTRDS
jgi:hypothetical protein